MTSGSNDDHIEHDFSFIGSYLHTKFEAHS